MNRRQGIPKWVLLLFVLVSTAPSSIHAVTIHYSGTVRFLFNPGGSRFDAAAVGSAFSGHFTYGDSVADVTAPPAVGIDEASYEFTGPPHSASATQGAVTTTSTRLRVDIENNVPLDDLGVSLFNTLLGGSFVVGSPFDTWGVNAFTDSAVIDPPGQEVDDGDFFLDGVFFSASAVSLDATLYSGVDYQSTPPSLGEVDVGLFRVVQRDAAGSLLFDATGTLDSLTVVPSPATAWLVCVGVGLIVARVRAVEQATLQPATATAIESPWAGPRQVKRPCGHISAHLLNRIELMATPGPTGTQTNSMDSNRRQETPACVTAVAASGPRVSLLTAYSCGAVGIIGVFGSSVQPLIARLTGIDDWPTSRVKLANLAQIDRGLVVRLRDDWFQITPHGGVRVVGKIIDRLVAMGAVYDAQPPAGVVFPEAGSGLEADMLACLAGAASPGAVDLLLAQPSLWRRWLADRRRSAGQTPDDSRGVADQPGEILDRSDRLDVLVNPPSVVVVGRPNVGKSTMTNRMLGRSASLVADLPGTTRDWVASLAEVGPLAVRWIDTPGLRTAADRVEQAAVELAAAVIKQADVLIAVRDPHTDWPGSQALMGCCPGIWVVNKIDQVVELESGGGHDPTSPLATSATTGQGLERLQGAVLQYLGLARLNQNDLWAFSPPLRRALATQRCDTLSAYAGLSAGDC